jgi:group I intron endonuclease
MKKARIYKIINTKTIDIYIGSTIQNLEKRFNAHRSNAKQNKNGKLYDCIREHGVKNFSIELIEEFEIEKIEEIGIRERKHYNELNPTLNMKIPNIVLHRNVGCIYKLFYTLDNSQFYVGSTVKNISQRLNDHQSASMKGKTPLYTYMKEKGRDNFSVELVEDNIENENLIIRENYWINELKPPLNKNIFLTRTEKERDKAKYEKNKEIIKKRVNDRRKLKRDEINAQKREHYEKNKESILAKQKTQEYKDRANNLRRERRAKQKLEL